MYRECFAGNFEKASALVGSSRAPLDQCLSGNTPVRNYPHQHLLCSPHITPILVRLFLLSRQGDQDSSSDESEEDEAEGAAGDNSNNRDTTMMDVETTAPSPGRVIDEDGWETVTKSRKPHR